MRPSRGFTMVELIVVVAVGAALAVLTFTAFAKLNAKEALDGAAGTVAAILNEARERSLAAELGDQYGVNFQGAQVVLFKGLSYATSSPYNATTTLDAHVGLRNIALAGGGASVVFKKLTGTTSQPGSVELYFKDGSRSKTVTVSATGVVDIN